MTLGDLHNLLILNNFPLIDPCPINTKHNLFHYLLSTHSAHYASCNFLLRMVNPKVSTAMLLHYLTFGLLCFYFISCLMKYFQRENFTSIFILAFALDDFAEGNN